MHKRTALKRILKFTLNVGKNCEKNKKNKSCFKLKTHTYILFTIEKPNGDGSPENHRDG